MSVRYVYVLQFNLRCNPGLCAVACWAVVGVGGRVYTKTHLKPPLVRTTLQPLPFQNAHHRKDLAASVQWMDGMLLLAE